MGGTDGLDRAYVGGPRTGGERRQVMPILPRTGCSPWPQPMPRPANPLAGEPPTGEPYAGNLLVRFGGRGKRLLIPTPIIPHALDARRMIAGMTDWNVRFMGSLSTHG